VSRTYFTDRDLGKQFPAILRAAGLVVERHADHFAPTASDEEWLALAGSNGWTAITHDARIRYKPNELAAVIRHHVALLVVVGSGALSTTGEELRGHGAENRGIPRPSHTAVHRQGLPGGAAGGRERRRAGGHQLVVSALVVRPTRSLGSSEEPPYD
jgi:hypothetical protein